MAIAVWLGVPALAFIPRLRSIPKRMLISTLMTWATLVLYFWFVGIPLAREVSESHGQAQERLARMTILFYGWIPAAIGTMIATAGYLLIRYVRTKRHNAA